MVQMVHAITWRSTNRSPPTNGCQKVYEVYRRTPTMPWVSGTAKITSRVPSAASALNSDTPSPPSAVAVFSENTLLHMSSFSPSSSSSTCIARDASASAVVTTAAPNQLSDPRPPAHHIRRDHAPTGLPPPLSASETRARRPRLHALRVGSSSSSGEGRAGGEEEEEEKEEDEEDEDAVLGDASLSFDRDRCCGCCRCVSIFRVSCLLCRVRRVGGEGESAAAAASSAPSLSLGDGAEPVAQMDMEGERDEASQEEGGERRRRLESDSTKGRRAEEQGVRVTDGCLGRAAA